MSDLLNVEVAYALPERQTVLCIRVAPGTSVLAAIEQSGIVQKHPEIDLSVNKFGIYSRPVKGSEPVQDGDRIEIYRPLIADPKEMRKKRAEKANISEAYVIFLQGEAFLFGSSFLPLNAASSHVVCDPTRTRKLLLSRRELDKLESLTARQGYTIVPLALYWKECWVKVEIGLVKGKKEHDKREDTKAREWDREKARIMKNKNRG